MTEEYKGDPLRQPNDTQIDQAIRLACAFIANGDIRLERNKRENPNADVCVQLGELIPQLYSMLGEAKHVILCQTMREADDVQAALANRQTNT